MYTDPDGRVLDTALDIGFITYDIGSLGKNLYQGNYTEAKTDAQALGLDTLGAAIPFGTGFGLAVRGGNEARLVGKVGKYGDDAVRIANELKQGVTNQKLLNIIDDLYKLTDNVMYGTAGAARKEILNPGLKIGERNHVGKAKQYINALNNVLNKNSLNKAEKNTAELLLNKLETAIKSK